MATHTVLIPNRIAAQTVDSYNRSVISGCDIDNGWVFYLNGQTQQAGATEVWDAFQPTTGSKVGLWMAYAPENVVTQSGNSKYRGIDPDPRNFYTSASTIFDAFKLQVGDIITLTGDALVTGTGVGSTYAVSTTDSFKFTWTNTGDTVGLTLLKYLGATYISVSSGSSIDSQRVTSYKFEVLSV